MSDLRIALRQYLRTPGFAVTVVCTLAITVGVTTAVFSRLEFGEGSAVLSSQV